MYKIITSQDYGQNNYLLLTVKTVKINILDKYVLLCVEGY